MIRLGAAGGAGGRSAPPACIDPFNNRRGDLIQPPPVPNSSSVSPLALHAATLAWGMRRDDRAGGQGRCTKGQSDDGR
jgi:hypothetical protein